MRGLSFARFALVISLALFAISMIVLKLAVATLGAVFWVAIIAVGGIVFSATACVVLQLMKAICKQVTSNG